MQWRNTSSTYGAVAKFLHWSIVILIICAVRDHRGRRGPGRRRRTSSRRIASHKSIGMLVLGLALARIALEIR